MMMRDVIYFGNNWVDEHKTSSHHIAEKLSKNHRVFYIESGGLRQPTLKKRDIEKILSFFVKICRGVKRKKENLYIYSIFQFPFHNNPLVRSFNKKIAIFLLKGLIKKFRIKDHILWFVVPHLPYLIGALEERSVVYYCTEDYSFFAGVDPEYVASQDAEMSMKADIIFVTSEGLLEKKKGLKTPVIYSPHAVDFSHFNKAWEKGELPEDIRAIRKPIIGMFGLIEERMDLALVKFLALSRPDWNFLFIGKVLIDIKDFDVYENVFFIGPRPYEKIPFYGRSFDVCIITYKQDERMKSINPLKLKEYLAMGKPLVSTPFKELKNYEGIVDIADTKEEFLKKIELALNSNSVELENKRMDSVRNDSWENVLERILSKINKL